MSEKGDLGFLTDDLLNALGGLAAHYELVIIENTSQWKIALPAEVQFLVIVPLAASDGDPLGALILLNGEPLRLGKNLRQSLHTISEIASDQLSARRERLSRSGEGAFKLEVERALAESQARYKRVSDNLPGMLFQYELHQDGSHSIPFVGGGSRELLGLEPEVLVSDPSLLFSYVHPDDADRLHQTIFESAVTGSVWDYEGRLVLPYGEVKWTKGVSRPEYRLNGTIHWDGMILDITEHKKAEFALLASEEKFRLTVESAMDGMVAIDFSGLVTGWNRQCEVIFGWLVEEALGRDFVGLVISPEFGDSLDQEMFRSLTHPEALNRRVVIKAHRRDGSSFPLEFAWTAVGQDETLTYVAFLRDITERKRAEEELKSAKEEAEKANRGKSEFLSRMSHELRTPLNAILGFGQLLEMDDLGEDSNESVGHILQAGRHLLGLINEVLDISRIESGNISFQLEPVVANRLVQEAIALVQPLADQRDVKLRTTFPDGPVSVFADAQRLKQVLLNLLSNGIKYTRDKGSVELSLSLEPGRVLFHVEDDGPGIPEESMERLFVPFDRLGADKTNVEGTGLGLPLTKRLVEAMGGQILVKSALGCGAKFTVSLPAQMLGELNHPASELLPQEPAA